MAYIPKGQDNIINVTGPSFKAKPGDYSKGAWNAAAFHDASIAAQEAKGILYIPSGNYYIGKGGTSPNGTAYGIPLVGRSYKIMGEGMQYTSLTYCADPGQGGPYDNLICQPEVGVYPAQEAQIGDLVISNLNLQGIDQNQVGFPKVKNCISARACTTTIIENIWMAGATLAGLNLWEWENYVRNCMFAYLYGNGINMLEGNGNRISECGFFAIAQIGLTSTFHTTLNIDSCIFEAIGACGILLESGAGVTINNNYFESTGFNGGPNFTYGNSDPGGLAFSAYGSRVNCDIYLNKGSVDYTDPAHVVVVNDPVAALTPNYSDGQPSVIIRGCYTRRATTEGSLVAGNVGDNILIENNVALDNNNYSVYPIVGQPRHSVYRYFADGTNGLVGKHEVRGNTGFKDPEPIVWSVGGNINMANACLSRVEGVPAINFLGSSDFEAEFPSVLAAGPTVATHVHSTLVLDPTQTRYGMPVYKYSGDASSADAFGVTIDLDKHVDLRNKVVYLAFEVKNDAGHPCNGVVPPWTNIPQAYEQFAIGLGSNTGGQYLCAGRYLNNDWNLRSYVAQLPASGLVTLGFGASWGAPATGLTVAAPALGLLGAPYTEVVRTNPSPLAITTPSDLDDVVLWLDGNDIVTSSGNLVSWASKVGGLVFGPSATVTVEAGINGFPAIRLPPGKELNLTSGTLLLPPPYTILAAFAALVDTQPVSFLYDGTNNFRIASPSSGNFNLGVVNAQGASFTTATVAAASLARLSTASGSGEAGLNELTATVSGAPATFNLGAGSKIGLAPAGTLVLTELLILRRNTIPSELTSYFKRKYNINLA